jgi:hypothetical protein
VREVSGVELAAPNAGSLVWAGGELYDVSAGWRHFPLDGSAPQSRYSRFGPSFDTAVSAPDGHVVALLTGNGTKGLLLEPGGTGIREVNRSFYHADAYRYPAALFTLPDGQSSLVHCPEKYNQLEIEVARTGERLTTAANRQPGDFFHSRLAVSSSGRYLLSAGWAWQPWGCVMVYDLLRALAHPATLDDVRSGELFRMFGLVQAEISGACFTGDDIIVSTSSEPNDPEDENDLAPCMLAR